MDINWTHYETRRWATLKIIEGEKHRRRPRTKSSLWCKSNEKIYGPEEPQGRIWENTVK